MAAEAARKLLVTDVIRVRSPRNLHLLVDVAGLNTSNHIGDLSERLLPCHCENGITFCERHRPIQQTGLQGFVHGWTRHVERVSWTVVTIHAVHLAANAGRFTAGVLHSLGLDPWNLL